MERLLVLLALVGTALGGAVIRMPFINPAGVTYVNSGPYAAAPAVQYASAPAVQYASAPALQYASAPAVHYPSASAVQYPSAPAVQYASAPAVPYVAAAPSAYALHQARIHQAGFAHTPVVHQAPVARVAPVVHTAPAYAAHVKYAAPITTVHGYAGHVKYGAVPTVHHVPGVADVPVTKYETHPGVVQQQHDIVHPAVKTRKYEIRRPAIQKEFYDIEERVIVKQAGSALLELDEPVSKTQKGDAIVRPLSAHGSIVQTPVVHNVIQRTQPVYHYPVAPAYKAVHFPTVARVAPVVPVAHSVPVAPYTRLQPIVPVRHYYPAYHFNSLHLQQPLYSPLANISSTTPYPLPAPQEPQPTPAEEQSQPQPQPTNDPNEVDIPQNDFQQDDDSITVDNPEVNFKSAPTFQSRSSLSTSTTTTTEAAQEELQSTVQMPEAAPTQEPSVRSLIPSARSFPYSFERLLPQARFSGNSLVPSIRNTPDISQTNQERLIQLLTGQGGITEVGFQRSGPSVSPVGEAGQVRGRVLSATPAPKDAEIQDERVNTRRVVVSRPIETLQEIEVVEPAAKFERITVNHPTFFKTARQGVVRVPTAVPVYGKSFGPIVAAPYVK